MLDCKFLPLHKFHSKHHQTVALRLNSVNWKRFQINLRWVLSVTMESQKPLSYPFSCWCLIPSNAMSKRREGQILWASWRRRQHWNLKNSIWWMKIIFSMEMSRIGKKTQDLRKDRRTKQKRMMMGLGTILGLAMMLLKKTWRKKVFWGKNEKLVFVSFLWRYLKSSIWSEFVAAFPLSYFALQTELIFFLLLKLTLYNLTEIFSNDERWKSAQKLSVSFLHRTIDKVFLEQIVKVFMLFYSQTIQLSKKL